jgi:hypothetical protein
MVMEKNAGNIMTTIQAGDFSLNINFSSEKAAVLKLLPGKKIILMFRSRDIEWR